MWGFTFSANQIYPKNTEIISSALIQPQKATSPEQEPPDLPSRCLYRKSPNVSELAPNMKNFNS